MVTAVAQVTAMVRVWSLAQELPHATSVAKKKKKKKIINKNGQYHLENGKCSRIKKLMSDNQTQCLKLDWSRFEQPAIKDIWGTVWEIWTWALN